MEKNSKFIKSMVKVVLIMLVINCVYFVADYFNVVSLLNIDVQKINWDISSIVISNCVVIGLYLITYIFLDKRHIEKEDNQRAVADMILLTTYESTLEIVELFENQEALESAAKKCDFEKLEFQDLVLQQYLNLPFQHNETIGEFAKNGIITAKEYKDYLSIKENYQKHIRIKLTFFDIELFHNYKKDDLMKLLYENLEKYGS